MPNKDYVKNCVAVYGVSDKKKEVLKNIAAHVGTTESAIVRNGLHLIFAQFPQQYQEPFKKD